MSRKFKFPRILNGNPLSGFEMRISKSDQCHNWVGSIASNGYGIYPTYKKYLGTHWAHRIAYILNKGTIPKNLEVMHLCDNKLCVNPAHLVLGTHAENERDKVQKGRSLSGTKHNMVKLTIEQVRQIRVMEGTCKSIGKTFGVSGSRVCEIRRGKSWKTE